MPTEVLIASKIYLPDAPLIQTIVMVTDLGEEGDNIVYDSDGEVVPFYKQVEDEGELNPPEEELVDMRRKTKRKTEATGAASVDIDLPELNLAVISRMAVTYLKVQLKAQKMSVRGLNMELSLRLDQAIEVNVPLVARLDK